MSAQSKETAAENTLVLKYREPTGEVNEKGEAVYGKSILLGEIRRAESKGKAFLVANDEAGNTYYIHRSKNQKPGPREPSHVLSVKPKDAESTDTAVLCGLFVSVQDTGAKVLKGKNKDTNIKYGIYPASQGGGNVRKATAADLF